MRCSIIARCAAFALLMFPISNHTNAEEANKAEIAALNKAMEKYQDYKVAVRDLYLSTVGCVEFDGVKKEGYMQYEKGAMGVHFANLTLRGPPDPMKPNVLIYEPDGKDLRLVAVEWLVPLTPETKEHPMLFGQKFQGPMEGHEPLIPKGFAHYDLHAWIMKDNPLGMFSPTNPNVKCDGYNQTLVEQGTMLVAGP
jgi:hypothetical protein